MTPVVFVHGMLGAPSSFDAVRSLLPSNVEVFTPWVAGHGPDRAPLPRDFDGAVDALASRVPAGCVVVGYSLGGRLALALSTKRRLGGLVLVGAHAGMDDADRPARCAWDDDAAALAARDLPALVDRWESLPVFATQTLEQRTAQRPTRLAHDPARVAWALSALGQGRMPDQRSTLARLTAPTRFMAGGLDTRLVASLPSLALSPHVHVTVVPERGHNLILEAPHAVAEQIASVHKELP